MPPPREGVPTMAAPLTVHTATIRTATIEVKTLTLSGRQITLSVFRQLQEESILDSERRPTHLRGVGWGWVNYCPGPGHCAWAEHGASSHRHLVWQRGEELRRCCFPQLGSGMHWEWCNKVEEVN